MMNTCKVIWKKGRLSPVFDLPDTWCGHTFTDKEKETLKAGKKVSLTDCVSSKTGNNFSCDIKLKDGKLTPNFKRR